MLDYAQARRLMVDCQLRTFDVNDVPVLDAFGEVARERFVPAGREDFAYIDQTLRLGRQGRAMPAPMLLARMIQALANPRFVDPDTTGIEAGRRETQPLEQDGVGNDRTRRRQSEQAELGRSQQLGDEETEDEVQAGIEDEGGDHGHGADRSSSDTSGTGGHPTKV